MLVSGRFELQFSIPFPFPFHPIIRVDSGVCTRTIFRGKDMSMSTKNIHETFRVRLDHFFPRRRKFRDRCFFSNSKRYRIRNESVGNNRTEEEGAFDSIVGGGVVGLLLRTHTRARHHTQLVHEWPLIGWKNARSRVCRRRVCEVMVSTSFYGLARARTYIPVCATSSSTSPLCALPCKTHTAPRACYFASSAPRTGSLDRSWKQQITTRVQLDKRNRFSIPDIPTPRNDPEISFYN